MKNASTKNDSPKTPGGISKSLLTPCRRVGLSRNWRNTGPSPFISPLSGSVLSSTEVKEPVKREARKRKDPEEKSEVTVEVEDVITESPNESSPIASQCDENIVGTPKSVAVPRKKKSKLLLSAISKNYQPTSPLQEHSKENDVSEDMNKDEINKPADETNCQNVVITPVRVKSINKSRKCVKLPKNKVETSVDISNEEVKEIKVDTANETCHKNQQKSPKELTKECIVVIQKKIFKTDKVPKNNEDSIKDKESYEKSDSDLDEVPLSHLNKKENIKTPTIILEDDDDFINTASKVKVKKFEHKTTSITGLKTKPKVKKKSEEVTKVVAKALVHADPDDDDFECKRTIVIKKTYDKVIKPLKAKSTGSITQKDIDEIKARIEAKKKLLLAKAMSTDTEELRSLVKKWQRGCQDALMELMDLMKAKFPDQNMSYTEMLQTLKIPASMVSYDSDNDCFLTPDDANIILSGI